VIEHFLLGICVGIILHIIWHAMKMSALRSRVKMDMEDLIEKWEKIKKLEGESDAKTDGQKRKTSKRNSR